MPYEVRGDLLCWIWTGWTDHQGTPCIRTSTKLTTARRYYWEREYGPIPEGKILIRLCRDRTCVRPLHHEPGTWSEWMQKMGRTKMTLSMARSALLMRKEGISLREVGRRLDVDAKTIKELETGVHWTVRKGGRDARAA